MVVVAVTSCLACWFGLVWFGLVWLVWWLLLLLLLLLRRFGGKGSEICHDLQDGGVATCALQFATVEKAGLQKGFAIEQ